MAAAQSQYSNRRSRVAYLVNICVVMLCKKGGVKKSDVAKAIVLLCFSNGYKARLTTSIRTTAFHGRMLLHEKDSN